MAIFVDENTLVLVQGLTGGWEWPIVVLIVLLGPMLWFGLGAGRDILLGQDADAPGISTTAGRDDQSFNRT